MDGDDMTLDRETEMRGIAKTTLAAFALFLPMACSAPDSEALDSTSGPDPGTPAELVATWVEMWNSYDLDQVQDLFLTDDRVSYFSSEFQGVIQGFGAVVEHHEGFGFVPGGDTSRGTRLWVEDLTGDRFGDAVVLTGVWYFERGTPAGQPEGAEGGVGGAGADTETSPPESLPQKGPVTFVCVLEDGAWRFAHMNFGNYLEEGSTETG